MPPENSALRAQRMHAPDRVSVAAGGENPIHKAGNLAKIRTKDFSDIELFHEPQIKSALNVKVQVEARTPTPSAWIEAESCGKV